MLSIFVLNGTPITLPHHPNLSLQSQITPTMKQKEYRMSNRQLRITHKSLQIVMHSIMTVLHTVLVVLVISRNVVPEKCVRLFKQRISVLEMRKRLVISISTSLREISLHPIPLLSTNPMEIPRLTTEKSIQLILIQCAQIYRGLGLHQTPVIFIRINLTSTVTNQKSAVSIQRTRKEIVRISVSRIYFSQ